MNDRPRIPDPETRKRHVEKLREVVRMYDDLNLLLDKAIAQAEEDIRHSPLTAYRLGKANRVTAQEKESDS
ncbi:hypothetical protein [Argonema antarcticum]|uniref:hypothetical protein n=1 Tax=Argonema antarcticum TaxID=2942763 RepID=UPI0020116CC5|nr:hypothetical protein [Argonema antarcticum]MCL1470777.1 hypothetical protein [Argonema antarcticum A004/B2]